MQELSAVPERSDGDAGAGHRTDSSDSALAHRIRARFAPLGGVALAEELREPVRPVPDLEPGS
jgi:hypothetical protein